MKPTTVKMPTSYAAKNGSLTTNQPILLQEQLELKGLEGLLKELSIYFKAKESDFDGFVLKDHAEIELQACINQIMKGKTFLSQALNEYFVVDDYPIENKVLGDLTSTEQKVLELVAENKSNLEIANFLFISEKTVESHKRNIYEKLELPKGKIYF